MATSWETYNLPAIWQMLEGENVCTGADRVLAWDGLATSVRDQHQRLLRAAEDLAQVWPPERNSSAKAFLRRIGDLAESMRTTMTCAEDTRAGLQGVTEAIGRAQNTVRTLAEGRAGVSTDWIPRFIDHAEDEYDEKAQQVMREADAAIADHGKQIKAPDLFEMEDKIGDRTPLPEEEEPRTRPGGSGLRATPVPVAVPHDPVLPETGSGSDTGDGGAEGPELSGVNPPPGPGAGAIPGAATGGGTPPGAVIGGGISPGAVIGGGILPGTAIGGGILPGTAIGGRGRPGTAIGGRPLPGTGTGGRPTPGTTVGGRALPGVVIGEGALPGTATGRGAAGRAPGVGASRGVGAPSGRPGALDGSRAGALDGQRAGALDERRAGALDGRRGASAGRGLPSGSFIGEGEVGAGQAPLTGRAGRGGHLDHPGFSAGGLACQQWETSEGVAPVIAPDTTVVRHDPGPGVLGIDR